MLSLTIDPASIFISSEPAASMTSSLSSRRRLAVTSHITPTTVATVSASVSSTDAGEATNS